jgi:predicted metal-dependent hydrolase
MRSGLSRRAAGWLRRCEMSMADGHPVADGPQLSLGLDEGPAAWHVRRSPRARRLSVRVYPGGRVEVVVPRGVGTRLVERFVLGHRPWITRKVDEMRALAPATMNPVPDSIELSAINEIWAVRDEPNARCNLRIGAAGERMLAQRDGAGDAVRQVTDDDVCRWLQGWLRSKARNALEPWITRIANELRIGFEGIEIRRQRTRWGSCSRSGVVSLNACLLFQRPEVVRYLLVHELCHREQMNHSPRFWALVAHHEPDFRALDRELGQGWRRVPAWVFTGSRDGLNPA